jgi:RNA ligase
MHIFELMDSNEYVDMLNQGYIRENVHPTLDIRIVNYTEKAQFDNKWNAVTKQCRGLIVDPVGRIIARPFDKFMNYGQEPSDIHLMNERVVVTDKMDGSLGILWSYNGEQGIATRGSFTSEQAVWATALWKAKYGFKVAPMWTYMFEIIYPQNRIVLNYGDMAELVLLGVRDIEEGYVLLPNDVYTWRGPRAQTFPYKTFREVLEAPQRPNAEGFVVYFPDVNYRIKLKQDDYVALHKIVTGLTARRVWESMGEGKTLEDMCAIVPDEWHGWLRAVVADLEFNFLKLRSKVRSQYKAVMEEMPLDYTRKDFALRVKDMEYSGLLFRILDGGNIQEDVWKLIKPSAE